MDNANLVTYVSRVLDAYNVMSKRMERLEHEVENLKAERDGKTSKPCRIYKMEIHGMANGK